MSTSIRVLKFGGSSVAEPKQIKSIAGKVAKLHREGIRLIVVVSAMGKTTDQLVDLAFSITPTPPARELDMLLSAGERISMSLMSMALQAEGCPSISFTGSQAGILTNDSHSNAAIREIKPIRLEQELAKNHVVVLAGFQGVSPTSKEVTTLGRGGSDTTAVAMAAQFKADLCEIRKDVDGVYSADPKLVKTAKHIPVISFKQLQEFTYWGAKVLNYRSVELAASCGVQLVIGLSTLEGNVTRVQKEVSNVEENKVLGINAHREVLKIQSSSARGLEDFFTCLEKSRTPMPQILHIETGEKETLVWVTGPQETRKILREVLPGNEFKIADENYALVSATCSGAYTSPFVGELASKLAKAGVVAKKTLFSPMSVSFLVTTPELELAQNTLVKMLHA